MGHWDMFDAFMARNSEKEEANANDGPDPRDYAMESDNRQHGNRAA